MSPPSFDARPLYRLVSTPHAQPTRYNRLACALPARTDRSANLISLPYARTHLPISGVNVFLFAFSLPSTYFFVGLFHHFQRRSLVHLRFIYHTQSSYSFVKLPRTPFRMPRSAMVGETTRVGEQSIGHSAR